MFWASYGNETAMIARTNADFRAKNLRFPADPHREACNSSALIKVWLQVRVLPGPPISVNDLGRKVGARVHHDGNGSGNNNRSLYGLALLADRAAAVRMKSGW